MFVRITKCIGPFGKVFAAVAFHISAHHLFTPHHGYFEKLWGQVTSSFFVYPFILFVKIQVKSTLPGRFIHNIMFPVIRNVMWLKCSLFIVIGLRFLMISTFCWVLYLCLVLIQYVLHRCNHNLYNFQERMYIRGYNFYLLLY